MDSDSYINFNIQLCFSCINLFPLLIQFKFIHTFLINGIITVAGARFGKTREKLLIVLGLLNSQSLFLLLTKSIDAKSFSSGTVARLFSKQSSFSSNKLKLQCTVTERYITVFNVTLFEHTALLPCELR